jgi:glyoxylase-like metal-dependent hydrolase (beta-lactamase superfamily II)
LSETLSYPFPDIPAEGEAIEVAEGILWMRQPLPMKLDHVNIYALDEGDSWTIVDTGFYSKRSVAIWEQLMAGPLGGRPVSRVIVTHHHPDHIGMAGWFQSEHGAELITTRTAWLMARMLVLDDQDRPTAESLQFWQHAGMDPEIFAQRACERPFNFSDCVAPMPLGYRRIREGDTLRAGGRDWAVRMGNGHAPEHATLWADGVVLGGDQLLPSISPNLGVYPTEPDADPVTDWLEACERLRVFATPDQLVLPGHKLPFTGLPLRMRQLIDNHNGALERLLKHLDTPKTAHECFMPLFKREIRGGEYGLALVESVAHCAHLYLAGQATRSLRHDGAYTYQRKGA